MTISLQILASEDEEVIGRVDYQGRVLTIGNSLKSGLFIKDDRLQDTHIRLELDESGLIIKSINETEYLLNNVRMIGNYRPNVGDRIAIGTTLIQVIAFQLPNSEEDVVPAKVKGVGRTVLEQLKKEIDD